MHGLGWPWAGLVSFLLWARVARHGVDLSGYRPAVFWARVVMCCERLGIDGPWAGLAMHQSGLTDMAGLVIAWAGLAMAIGCAGNLPAILCVGHGVHRLWTGHGLGRPAVHSAGHWLGCKLAGDGLGRP
jgi:hypothetical protein